MNSKKKHICAYADYPLISSEPYYSFCRKENRMSTEMIQCNCAHF